MKAELDQVAFHLDAANKALDAGYSSGAWTEIGSAAVILEALTLAVAQNAVHNITQNAAIVPPIVEPQRAMAMAAAA